MNETKVDIIGKTSIIPTEVPIFQDEDFEPLDIVRDKLAECAVAKPFYLDEAYTYMCERFPSKELKILIRKTSMELREPNLPTKKASKHCKARQQRFKARHKK